MILLNHIEGGSFSRMSIGDDVNAEEQENTAYNFYQLDYWNPFIESLPDKLSKSGLFGVLKSEPEFDEAEKWESNNIGSHCIYRLNDLFVPLQSHFLIYEFLYETINQGYYNRYSHISDYNASVKKIDDLKRNYEDLGVAKLSETNESNHRRNLVNTIEGVECNGKSRMLEKLLSVFPQVIRHRRYRNLTFIKTQVVWIKVDYPFDGTLKTFCMSIFRYLDEILKSNFVSKFGHSKNTEELMLIYVSHLLSLYSVGLLMIDNIDEIHLSTKKSKYLLRSIHKLSKLSNVPVITVVSSRVDVIKLLENQPTSNENGLVFYSFGTASECHNFIETILKYQWIQFDKNFEKEYKELLLKHCQGAIGKMVELHRDVQEHSMDLGVEIITNEVIEVLRCENKLRVQV